MCECHDTWFDLKLIYQILPVYRTFIILCHPAVQWSDRFDFPCQFIFAPPSPRDQIIYSFSMVIFSYHTTATTDIRHVLISRPLCFSVIIASQFITRSISRCVIRQLLWFLITITVPMRLYVTRLSLYVYQSHSPNCYKFLKKSALIEQYAHSNLIFFFLSLPTRLIDRTNNRNNRLSAIAQTKTCLFSTYFSCVAAVVLIFFCVILAIAEAKDWERSSASRESGPNAGRLQADHLGSESAGQEQIGADQKSI